ncbi:MAG: hypothetical protein NTV89_03820 [Proteobacteria bacterium]|nr:hypothetical protein [Pseudomonadota bacterium]
MTLEEMLAELRNKITFKKNTAAGDVVLVGMKPGLFYGVVLDIKPNVKKEWWDVSFKLLVMPPVDITWILRTPQMNGEPFTIGGEEHFMIAIDMGLQKQPLKKTGARPVLSIVKQDDDNGSGDEDA